MNKLRIAMIIQAYYPYPYIGGAERQLAALVPLLTARGATIRIFTRQYAGLSRFELIDGVEVERIPIPGPKAVASIAFTLGTVRALHRWKPDVIHAHELLSPTTTAVAAKRWFGTPVVAKVLRGGELGDIAKLQTRRGGISRLNLFKEQVNRFICISQEIDAELQAIGTADKQRIFIPNGVDTDQYRPVTAAQKGELKQTLALPEGKIVLFTGRLSPEKRVNHLISIWPSVRQQYPDAQLVLVGTGKDEAALKAQAGDGVHFVGRVPDVTVYLQAADVFVLPSVTEGLSNALLEAMAAGLPAVATRVGGAPDIISEGKTGMLVPPDDPEQLKAALLAVLADARGQAEMGAAGRQVIVDRYGLTAVADQLRHLYEVVYGEGKS